MNSPGALQQSQPEALPLAAPESCHPVLIPQLLVAFQGRSALRRDEATVNLNPMPRRCMHVNTLMCH